METQTLPPSGRPRVSPWLRCRWTNLIPLFFVPTTICLQLARPVLLNRCIVRRGRFALSFRTVREGGKWTISSLSEYPKRKSACAGGVFVKFPPVALMILWRLHSSRWGLTHTPLLLSIFILAIFLKLCQTLKLLALWHCPLPDWTARHGPSRTFQKLPVLSANIQDSELESGYLLIGKGTWDQRQGKPRLAHSSSSRPSLYSLASFMIFILRILIYFPQTH